MSQFSASRFCGNLLMADVTSAWIVIFITATFILLAASWKCRRNKFNYFKKIGLPGPETSLISGNFHDIWSEDALNVLNGWSRKYGDIYGFFNGDCPFVMVKDLDLLRRIFVTDFGKFINRGDVWLMLNKSPMLHNAITFSVDERWKFIRRLVSSTFSPSKLRRMMDSLNDAVDKFLDLLEKKSMEASHREVDVCPLMAALSFDVAAEIACGLYLDVQHKPSDTYYNSAQSLIMNLVESGYQKAGQFFSGLKVMVPLVGLLERHFGHEYLADLVQKAMPIVELRARDHSLSRPDLIEKFLEAKVPEELLGNPEFRTRPSDKGGYLVPLSDIAANAGTILVAGFETVKLSSAYCIYCLAKYPEVQQKVREEVYAAQEKHCGFSYEALGDLQYTTQVISETQRLYTSVFSFTTRKASCDYRYKDLTLPKGVNIMVPTEQIHMDPSLWDEPEKFNPDRFAPEETESRDPLAFQPYGVGPRHCVGMKLAQTTMTLLIAKLVFHFRLHLGASHKSGDLERKAQSVLVAPKGGVWIRPENNCHKPGTVDLK